MLVDEELDDFVADPASFRDVLRERQRRGSQLADLEPPYFVEGDKGDPAAAPALRPARASGPVDVAKPGDVLRRRAGLRGRGQGPGPHRHRPGGPVGARAGRHPRRPAHRSVVDAAVRARRRRWSSTSAP